jgi:uncharacterized SAM-binding protein YcdF (DUF218 family)
MTYTEPLLLVFLAMAFCGLLAPSRAKRKHLALAGVVGLFLISWPPVDWLMGMPLEARYAIRTFQRPADLEAIAILASNVRLPEPGRPYPLPDRDTFDRCEHAAWIYRHGRPLPILACQGAQRDAQSGDIMRGLLVQAGVPENMIWMEDKSRSTHENAVFGARILRAHGVRRIALVVDAQSMPRAAACFRKEGIDVTPAPVEFRTWGPLRDELLPNWHAIRRNEITLHELLGLAWYRLRGWT